MPDRTAPDEPGSLEAIAPLARLVLNIRLALLAVGTVSLATSARTGTALVLLAVMAVTSFVPIMLWSRIGPLLLAHPLAMLPDLLVGLAVVVVAPSSLVGTSYAAATAVLAGALYGRVGGMVLTGVLLAGRVWRFGDEPWPDMVVGAALLVLATIVGGVLRDLLLDVHRSRRTATVATRRLATAEERERLARELHDSVAKTIQGVGLTASALARTRDAPASVQALSRRIAEDADRAVRETRALLHGLRVDDVRQPLDDSLAAIVDTFGRLNELDTRLEVEPVTCDDDVRYQVVQVLRESLRNVDAHAEARRVWVSLACSGTDDLRLVVRDDGEGFDPDAVGDGHYGVRGMRERATSVRGTLALDTAPGRGTTVTLTAPRSAPT